MADPAPPAALVGGAAPASRRRRPVRLLFAAALAVLLVLLVLTAAVILDRLLGRTSVVGGVQQQPASVKYQDGRTHYAAVTHTRSWVFDRHVNYRLYTGSDPSLHYGYFVRLGFGMPEQRPVIKAVKWDDRGVRVTFASGHEVFVPARHFVGGR
ncbi:hypothetical protein [Actinomadura sp. B10D3]|uniref:hypothetical protein n=1 Tax=Actinomadura sp. B10D3 TaxID=3153557 RepID=UPI00325C6D86